MMYILRGGRKYYLKEKIETALHQQYNIKTKKLWETSYWGLFASRNEGKYTIQKWILQAPYKGCHKSSFNWSGKEYLLIVNKNTIMNRTQVDNFKSFMFYVSSLSDDILSEAAIRDGGWEVIYPRTPYLFESIWDVQFITEMTEVYKKIAEVRQ